MTGSLRYLHCLIDEKFIDGAISLFETDDRVHNDYVLFDNSDYPNGFKYIRDTRVKQQSIDSFLDTAKNYNVVLLHNLSSIPIRLIAQIPNGIKVIWLMWGIDFYNKDVCDIELLHKKTKETLTLRNKLGIIKADLLHLLYRHSVYKRGLNRIDYFSGVFPYEYSLLKSLKQYPHIKAKQLDFYYGSTNFFVPENPERIINNKRRNIIIGNSADPRNNTLDVFDLIKDTIDITEIDSVIVPLSYGRNLIFKNKVKEVGKELWGKKFQPLDSFMPLDEYLQLISNCKTAVYFHERQQASDNILMQLLYGARVFLSDTCGMYKYLKERGYMVFSLQKDLALFNTPLSDIDVIKNRHLLSCEYSSSKLIERITRMNDVLMADF